MSKTFSERLTSSLERAGVDTNHGVQKLVSDELRRRGGKATPQAVHKWFTGETEPGKQNITVLSKWLGVSPEWLAFGATQDSTIHRLSSLEESMTAESGVAEGPAIYGRVPLISSVTAGEFCEASDPLPPGVAEDWILSPAAHSTRSYALRVTGPSMEPRFMEGEIIIVDPERDAAPGSFVVAKRLEKHDVTLKQLVQDSEGHYLRAVNPDWPQRIIRVDEEWTICGVVIAKVEMF